MQLFTHDYDYIIYIVRRKAAWHFHQVPCRQKILLKQAAAFTRPFVFHIERAARDKGQPCFFISFWTGLPLRRRAA
jgi:hypothetical protein